MSVLVSIIVPVFNAAPYLDACLRSVGDQSYTNLEVIIINDGSTDESEEIIMKYTSANSRYKYFTQVNRGLGYTRNRGLSLSKGSYVFFLDSDDLIPQKSIQSLVTAITKYDAHYAVGKALRITDERNYITKRQVDFSLYNTKESLTIYDQPEMLQDSIACNKLWKKDFLTQNNLEFTVGKYYEDLYMTMRAAILADKIAVTNEVVYHWRVRERLNEPSITQQQMTLKNTKDRLSALRMNREWLIKFQIDSVILAQHDLKSLLDVLGLHVVKFALVAPLERDSWLIEVTAFLDEIPIGTVDGLPEIEKNLYHLLKNKNYTDLLLFTQMYTNTETQPIVVQMGQNFKLEGKNQDYEVTKFLKPTIMVKELIKSNNMWTLRGCLTVPKATYPIEGSFYGVGRLKDDIIEAGTLNTKQQIQKSFYPFQNQTFEVNLYPRLFLDESVYDFFFRLSGDEELHLPVRVRIKTKIPEQNALNYGGMVLNLYRTNHGNLSLSVQKKSVQKSLKKLLKKILGK